jgi:hypothetical protein
LIGSAVRRARVAAHRAVRAAPEGLEGPAVHVAQAAPADRAAGVPTAAVVAAAAVVVVHAGR